jgi:hypothetical protein
MKYPISKKRLKSGESLLVSMTLEYHEMQDNMEIYKTTSDEIFKLMIECRTEYIDIHFNYGYSITSIKTFLLDEPNYCKEYIRITTGLICFFPVSI